MIKVENRESAHLRSRVKDLSVVPNVASFNALLACITPIAKVAKNEEGLYEPILVRDNETLIANFGDPRIDPEKYVDLYSIMQVVGNGGTCYVAKVDSGNAGVYHFPFQADPVIQDEDPEYSTLNHNKNKTVWYSVRKNKTSVVGVKGSREVNPDGDDIEDNNFVFYTVPFTVITDDGGTPEDPSDDTNITVNTDNLPKLANEIDFAGSFTWECLSIDDFQTKYNIIPDRPDEDADDYKYVVAITLPEGAADDLTALQIISVIEPSWGSELKSFSVDADNNQVNYKDNSEKDSSDKTVSITLSSNDVKNDYIVINPSIEDLKSGGSLDLTVSIEDTETTIKPSNIEYGFDGSKLNLTVTYEFTDDNKEALITAIKSRTDLSFNVTESVRKSHAMIAYSSMTENLQFNVYLSQVKPYSLGAFYLNVEVRNNSGTNLLGSAKIKLENTTTNQGLVNSLNSALGTVVRFELLDPSTGSACGVKERGANSIARALLDTCEANKPLKKTHSLSNVITVDEPSFEVDVDDYVAALKQYKAKKYVGCLMADMVCPVTQDHEGTTSGSKEDHEKPYPLNAFDRRTLHYHMKDIAFERKDTTVILSTPYTPGYDNPTALTIDDACDWVSSNGAYADLWEYGQGATTDYATQSFYLEMYYSWLEMPCNWIVNGAAKSKKVKIAPSNFVINNVLKSWRERGVQYPVAGDQGGVLPDTCRVLINPKTKLERDQLVQYRINPIWDTGTRGVQIFGNETLNAGYTDLNAAHIARALVYIRSTIDEYTEKLKFSINSMVLWDQWKTYVSQYILEPLKTSNCLAEYRIAMGEDTTSREEIANRTINGIIQLIFYQSAEIFDLTYVVYSSATTIDEAMNNV